MSFVVGAIVRVKPDAPPAYKNVRGLIGRVEKVFGEAPLAFADVNFDIGHGYETGKAFPFPAILFKYLMGAASEAKQTKRPPLFLHEPTDDRTEKEKQDEAVAWLEYPDHGYVVLTTGQVTKRSVCPECQTPFWPHTGYGNTPGFPDLTIFHPTRWVPAGQHIPALLLEFKQSEKAERKPEQVALAEQGVSVFVWSLTMVAREIYRFEREVLRVTPHPALLQFLEDSLER